MAHSTPPGKNPAVRVAVTVLLVVGVAGALWVPLYARSAPNLGDFPFFYWFQLIWMPVVALMVWLAYLLTRTKTAAAGQEDEK